MHVDNGDTRKPKPPRMPHHERLLKSPRVDFTNSLIDTDVAQTSIDNQVISAMGSALPGPNVDCIRMAIISPLVLVYRPRYTQQLTSMKTPCK